MTFKQLCDQCDALNDLTGRKFSIKGQNHVVCLMDENSSPYTPWTSNNKTLAQWMEFMRRGYEIGRARAEMAEDMSKELDRRLHALRACALDSGNLAYRSAKEIRDHLLQLCDGRFSV
jgi:hypothetical protein